MQLPASASQTLYSRREAEAGSTSNYVISETSNSEMLLNWCGDQHKNVRDDFRAFKRQILENFKYYRVPVIALDRSTSKEAVCVVFEKVNTGGKPLDAFELVTAMYAAWP